MDYRNIQFYLLFDSSWYLVLLSSSINMKLFICLFSIVICNFCIVHIFNRVSICKTTRTKLTQVSRMFCKYYNKFLYLLQKYTVCVNLPNDLSKI